MLLLMLLLQSNVVFAVNVISIIAINVLIVAAAGIVIVVVVNVILNIVGNPAVATIIVFVFLATIVHFDFNKFYLFFNYDNPGDELKGSR